MNLATQEVTGLIQSSDAKRLQFQFLAFDEYLPTATRTVATTVIEIIKTANLFLFLRISVPL